VSLPLHTERLILRPFADDDTERILEVFGDPEVMRYVGRGVPLDRDRLVASQARVLEHWRTHGFGPLALVERASGTVIGEGGLQLLEGGPDVEVTYTLARAFWGLGYATEAAVAVLEWGFGKLGLTRIVGVAYPDNTASQRVLQKIGMRRLGLRRCYGAELVEYVAERPVGAAAQEAPASAG
jgi:ribosomal-protein-alanine N-acetyltransferase